MASATILTNGKALYAYNGTEWVPLNTAGNLVNSTRWQKTTTAAQTSLSGNDDYGDPLIYTPGYEQLYLNGVLLARDVDYTATNGTTITGLAPLTAGHIIEIIAYNNINVGNTYTQAQIDNKIANTFERWVDTLSASATVLSGLDDNSNTLSYTPGLEQVYVNGILLLPSEYTATSGSSVVLSEVAVSGDVIQVYALKNFRVPNTYTIAQTDDQFLTKTSASGIYLSQAAGITAATASATYAPVAAGGLVQITPTSIAATGGSGSIASTGTISFTSASAISFNGCFSSSYNDYLVKILLKSSNTTDIGFRNRLSGTDASGANYNEQFFAAESTSAQLSRTTGATVGNSMRTVLSEQQSCQLLLGSPFLTEPTQFEFFQVLNHANPQTRIRSGFHTLGTSYDGFSLIAGAGTMTGTVQIYGYRK